MALRVDFHDIKRALDRGSITPIEALHNWTTWALKQTTLELKPYFEYVRETLPIVTWHKPDEELLVRGYLPVTWTCPTDFYQWADAFMGQVFTMGAHLRRYIAERDPEHAKAVLDDALREIQTAVDLARNDPLKAHRRPTTEEVAAQVEAARQVPMGHDGQIDKGSNTTFNDRGQTYTLRRLARDRPDLLDRIQAGELTANAAAIEAGFRRPMKSVPVDSPESAVRALLKVFSIEDLVRAVGVIADSA